MIEQSVIKFYNEIKSYIFITKCSSADVFFHVSDVLGDDEVITKDVRV